MVATVLAALVAVLVIVPQARSQAIPPPPPNPGDEPAQAPAPKPPPPPKRATCPRCGYMCDPDWHFCAACGWDMTRLVGAAEEDRLQVMARGTVRVVVGGRRNRHATAFPFRGTNLLLTNARMLIGADESLLRVLTYDNHEYPASIVGYDLPTGIGLIQAVAAALPQLETAPAPAAVPESTWAVCYPVAFEDDVVRYLPVSLHRGQLTALGQSGTSLASFENLLRTDHTIESGCVGGPVVDSRGRIIGMILGSPDDGITYAMPLDGLAPIVASLVKGERPVRPYFGLGLVPPDERRRLKFGLDGSVDRPVIGYVVPGSPAVAAGVRPGDVLMAVGDASVTSVWDAGSRLLAAAPGGAGITLTLVRGGAEQHATVAPVTRPERVLLEPIDEIEESLEANIKESTEGPNPQNALVIADLVRGGRGERDHFKNGDVILEVDDKTVKSRQVFNDVIHTKFKKIFDDKNPSDRRFASSYVVTLEVRTAWKDRVTHTYVNLFPDILAPPVY